MDITGADLLPIEDMCMWTNEKSLNPAVQPRVTRFTQILSNAGSFPPNWNVSQPHFDMPMLEFLSPIKTDFQGVHRRNVL